MTAELSIYAGDEVLTFLRIEDAYVRAYQPRIGPAHRVPLGAIASWVNDTVPTHNRVPVSDDELQRVMSEDQIVVTANEHGIHVYVDRMSEWAKRVFEVETL